MPVTLFVGVWLNVGNGVLVIVGDIAGVAGGVAVGVFVNPLLESGVPDNDTVGVAVLEAEILIVGVLVTVKETVPVFVKLIVGVPVKDLEGVGVKVIVDDGVLVGVNVGCGVLVRVGVGVPLFGGDDVGVLEDAGLEPAETTGTAVPATGVV